MNPSDRHQGRLTRRSDVPEDELILAAVRQRLRLDELGDAGESLVLHEEGGG